MGISILLFVGRAPTTTGNPFITEHVDYSVTFQDQEKLLASYQLFIERAQDFSRVITEDALQTEIQDAQEYLREHPQEKHTENIGNTIQEALNIDFLLEGIEQRPLTVITTATHQRDGYTEKELIFDDPWVGQTKVHLLIPDNADTKPLPAVIGVYGHADSATVFRSQYFGAELAKAGFVVLIPAVQTLEHPDLDEILSKKLYLNGFTLMGIRVYKINLFLKYLQHLEQVNNQQISLMGHSGGSSTVLLVAQHAPQYFNALVYDLDGTYLDMWSDNPQLIHCETIPRLAYYRAQIHDVSKLPFPARKFEYGYPGPHDRNKVIRFLQAASINE